MEIGSAVFAAGLALFFAAGFTFMAVLFSSGGASRSKQFQVLAALVRGQQGPVRKRLTIASLAGVVLGVLVIFTGVGMQDAERARRCRVHCTSQGYEAGKIGPSVQVHPTRRNMPAFVACTCKGGKEPPLEVQADTL